MNAPISHFHFGARSRREMAQMHPDLVRVNEMALSISPVDWGVFDGFRTAADQNELYRRKASQLDGYKRKSKHQLQPDGYVHATDNVPWINGKWQWDWEAIYEIADAMVFAARSLDVTLRWGGCWQVVNDLTGSPENWVAEYVKRRREQGRRAFNDGPHWEIVRSVA